MADAAPSDLTRILARADAGDETWREILPLVYDELRSLANRRMASERGAHTLQATALVHEAWIRLSGDTAMAWSSRRHFFGAAARAMQRVLVDHARRSRSDKRGGGAERLSLSVGGFSTDADPERLLTLHDAVEKLEVEDRQSAEVARLKLFAGLEVADVAKALEISERTVAREWAFARARLGELLAD